MKLNKLSKKNKIYLGILLGLILVLLSYLLINYIKMEYRKYKHTDDSVRINDILLASFNKEITILEDVIVKHQAYTKDERLTMGVLVYDLAKDEYIPILNYLSDVNNDENLLNGMNEILDFITDVHLTLYDERINIISKNSEGKNFKKVDNKYVYLVKKKYIPKEEFNKLYYEYLDTLNYSNVNNYFIDSLFNELNNKYTLDMLKNEINNNYTNFYQENKKMIISVIGNDLVNFAEYCTNNYIRKLYDENGNYIGRELIKNILLKDMQIEYVFARVGRIHKSFDKYEVFEYKLDLNHLWEQLDEMNLPMFYC